MNVIDAAHHTVHSYPGGVAALAVRLIRRDAEGKVVFDDEGNPKGMSPAVLGSKVNPNTHTHHLTLVEASEVMGLTSDYLMLQCLAAEHGFTLQRMGAEASGSVMGAMLESASMQGAFAQAMREALADGLITESEMRAISAAGAAQMEATINLLARLRAVTGKRGVTA